MMSAVRPKRRQRTLAKRRSIIGPNNAVSHRTSSAPTRWTVARISQVRTRRRSASMVRIREASPSVLVRARTPSRAAPRSWAWIPAACATTSIGVRSSGPASPWRVIRSIKKSTHGVCRATPTTTATTVRTPAPTAIRSRRAPAPQSTRRRGERVGGAQCGRRFGSPPQRLQQAGREGVTRAGAVEQLQRHRGRPHDRLPIRPDRAGRAELDDGGTEPGGQLAHGHLGRGRARQHRGFVEIGQQQDAGADDLFGEAGRPELGERGRGRGVDRDREPGRAGQFEGTQGGIVGVVEQRVGRQVQLPAVGKQRRFEIGGPELGVRAGIGDHRPLARRVDQDDAAAGAAAASRGRSRRRPRRGRRERAVRAGRCRSRRSGPPQHRPRPASRRCSPPIRRRGTGCSPGCPNRSRAGPAARRRCRSSRRRRRSLPWLIGGRTRPRPRRPVWHWTGRGRCWSPARRRAFPG